MQKLSRREIWLLATLIVLPLLVLPIGWVLDQSACCNWLSREAVIDLAVIWPVVLGAVGLLVQLTPSGVQSAERAKSDDTATRITELRQSLLLAKSPQALKRLLNQVET